MSEGSHQNLISLLKELDDYNLENMFKVYTNEDGLYYYNILNTTNFPVEISNTLFTTYTTGPKESWASISYKNYNTIKLWWLIASVNQIDNTVSFVAPSTDLKILEGSVVRQILQDIVNNGQG